MTIEIMPLTSVIGLPEVLILRAFGVCDNKKTILITDKDFQ